FSGNTNSVAEVGALGRLAQILALASLLNQFFVQPHFAQIHDSQRFERRAAALTGSLLLAGVILITSTVVFPTVWLFVFGPHYRHLDEALPWVVFGAFSSTAAV